MRSKMALFLDDAFCSSLAHWVSDGGGPPRRSAPVLGSSNVRTRASPNGIGRIGTTGARCARGRAHSDNGVVRRHREAVKKLKKLVETGTSTIGNQRLAKVDFGNF